MLVEMLRNPDRIKKCMSDFAGMHRGAYKYRWLSVKQSLYLERLR